MQMLFFQLDVQAAGAGELTKVMDGVIVQRPDGQLLPVEEDGFSCDWTCVMLAA